MATVNSSGRSVSGERRIPISTYRLQFSGELNFQTATGLVAYLQELGISDCYASPIFQACPDSTHGYDVCDYNCFHAQAGTQLEFTAFAERLREAGMGLLLDMVPNHMGIAHSTNRWWQDVLRFGRESAYAHYFDIDWDSAHPGLRGKVLLPVLGDYFGKVLERGELKVVQEDGRLLIAYHDRRFPVSPEGEALITEINPVLEQALAELNPPPGAAPVRFDLLEQLLEHQHYRLAFWRVGPAELNYRRFFDVTDLAGLRMECDEVFHASHQLVFRLLRENLIHGLRIDHPDGLRDPAAYFRKLQDTTAQGGSSPTARPTAPAQSRLTDQSARDGRSLFLVVEKILAHDELLPADWPVDGTTGYDFLNLVNGLFVGADNAETFTQIYRDFVGKGMNYKDISRQSKLRVMRASLASEVHMLAAQLRRISARQRHARDFTFEQLSQALREFVAAMPIYRTYLSVDRPHPSSDERQRLQAAFTDARQARPDLDPALFEFILHQVLEGAKHSEEALEFVLRFQQLTGPVMAKGVEDTAFYTYNRLISLNEVGGSPDQFGHSLAVFHATNRVRCGSWPHSLLATATHDTKRGEDVRARLNVLSEMPSEWERAVTHWARLNAPFKVALDNLPCPDANIEYLFYQTLVGAWPVSLDQGFLPRIQGALLKSVREAKQLTSWLNPNEPYESALRQFIGQVLADSNNEFRSNFLRLQQRIAFFGYWNSLAQLLLKATSPGVPDFYQGCELWDFSLVDPDNRRPIDFAQRRSLFAKVRQEKGVAFLESLLANPEDGRVKLFLTHRLLTYRREHAELFAHGSYVAVWAEGRKAVHVVSYLRSADRGKVLVVAPRLVLGLTEGREIVPLGKQCWKETWLELPPELGSGQFRNILTDEIISSEASPTGNRLSVETVLQHFPVALLEKV